MTEKDHLDELLNNAREKSMWQDIETAPKDGTWFLAYQAGNEPQFFTCASYQDKWTRDEDYRDQPPVPTHWQPLPTPPKPKDTSP